MKILFALSAVSVSFSSLALAQTQRDLDSHVHGAALLNVAVSESNVLLEFSSPWNNLVGFEHAPSTDEQHALVDEAVGQLNDPGQLFMFDAGDCSLEDVMLENTMASNEHDDEHDGEHDHDNKHGEKHGDEHDHADEHDDKHGEEHDHDDEHGDKHGDKHDHDDEHADTHSTVFVTYSYQCKDLGKLSSIDVMMFSLWSGLKDLDAQLIGEQGQALVELNPSHIRIDLGSVK